MGELWKRDKSLSVFVRKAESLPNTRAEERESRDDHNDHRLIYRAVLNTYVSTSLYSSKSNPSKNEPPSPPSASSNSSPHPPPNASPPPAGASGGGADPGAGAPPENP
jgi:hypothetical protein